MITAEMKQKVVDRVQQCLDIARDRLNVDLPFPKIRYDVRGRTAGYARYAENSIDLNQVLLAENEEEFIFQTVGHEVAHLIAGHKYGLRIQAHGREWKYVMETLGMNPDRCHDFDTTNTKVKTSTHYEYQCQCKTHWFGAKSHKKARNYYNMTAHDFYRCRSCRSMCSYTGNIKIHEPGKEPIIRNEAARPSLPDTMKPALRIMHTGMGDVGIIDLPRKTGTKMEQARAIYQANPTATRQELINMFVKHIGMTPAGASTYVYNLRKGK